MPKQSSGQLYFDLKKSINAKKQKDIYENRKKKLRENLKKRKKIKDNPVPKKEEKMHDIDKPITLDDLTNPDKS